jgi:hypothetical protein
VLAGWAAGGLVLMSVPVLAPLVHRLARGAEAVVTWVRGGVGLARPARMRP